MDALPTTKRARTRKEAATASKDKILKAATRIFAKHSYAGGSIDKISQTAQTNDRMIYYYFGSKEQLYIAVLEDTYQQLSDAEEKLALPTTQPINALKAFIQFMWQYYQTHPEFITLLNTENLYHGKYIAKSKKTHEYSHRAVNQLNEIITNGGEQGLFRTDLTGRELYLLVTSMTYFYHSNRYTLSTFLNADLSSDEQKSNWLRFTMDTVISRVLK